MLRKSGLGAVLLGLAVQCSVAAPRPAVDARIVSSAIVIENRSAHTVCYAVHESDLLTKIEWGPACSGTNRIAPRKSIRLAIEPGDFEPSGEAVVSWWFEGGTVVEGSIALKVR